MSRPRNPWRRHAEGMAPTPPRAGEQPYLFAYDVAEPRRGRRVLACLRRWRCDGQRSVHEAWLTPNLAEAAAVEALDWLDPAADRLLVGRLSRRAGAPVYTLSRPPPAWPVLGAPKPVRPARLAAGWYLLAYDIREPRRLRQVQQAAARACLALQQSVYLYHGGGGALAEVLAEVADLIHHGNDDVRLYALNGPGDLWFPCGPLPPLPAWGGF
jgi:CRISPR/Cas system-associated endoribonuclease Cas2